MKASSLRKAQFRLVNSILIAGRTVLYGQKVRCIFDRFWLFSTGFFQY